MSLVEKHVNFSVDDEVKNVQIGLFLMYSLNIAVAQMDM